MCTMQAFPEKETKENFSTPLPHPSTLNRHHHKSFNPLLLLLLLFLLPPPPDAKDQFSIQGEITALLGGGWVEKKEKEEPIKFYDDDDPDGDRGREGDLLVGPN